MFGLGLVLEGCKLILRFARLYYIKRKENYSAAQQSALDGLFAAAQVVENVCARVIEP